MSTFLHFFYIPDLVKIMKYLPTLVRSILWFGQIKVFCKDLSIDSKLVLQVLEVHNFTQDDLLSDDVMILDFHNVIYVWVGQHTSPDNKGHTLDIAKVLLIP